MSLRSILSGVKECHNCEALGIHCQEFTEGIFGPRRSSVYVGNEQAIIDTWETIDQCPVIVGRATNLQVAEKLKKSVKLIERAYRKIDQEENIYDKSRFP